jgi:rRNA-processing protein FCF1
VKSLLIVDAANVVGSVPDGWWRNRRAAVARLRDSLARLADDYDVVLVVEGAARGIDPVPGVRVEHAPRSGDDTIVQLAAAARPDRKRVVVTADRALRERVTALGAEVIGPRAVWG